ncbi:hypothetical protein CIHG_07089 [Coccidioides immitis H538.4]|uniref:DDE-1 domain-containing protein n=1 Tax=Coccidioides immitis H538.4 TaxID=396776 RepID=A0A0J8RWK9_COCIT|nr:hypothetical protein CIHG_07089 [Coccidioides immitis H538.4]
MKSKAYNYVPLTSKGGMRIMPSRKGPRTLTTLLAASENGWSSDNFGLEFLKCFDQLTRDKAGGSKGSRRGKRLLIVDGHSSHVNMKYIEYTDANNILLAVFPPHSAHHLQPRDVGIFGPLSSAYSEYMDDFLCGGFGFDQMNKSSFWQIFHPAWKDATMPKTPTSATRICILSQCLSQIPQLPSEIKLLVKATERLVLHNEALVVENQGLTQALRVERKQRRCGRAMGLLDPEKPGQAQFFSPKKVAQAREKFLELENKKEQEQAQKEHDKLQKVIAREVKAAEAPEQKKAREAKKKPIKLPKKLKKKLNVLNERLVKPLN